MKQAKFAKFDHFEEEKIVFFFLVDAKQKPTLEETTFAGGAIECWEIAQPPRHGLQLQGI